MKYYKNSFISLDNSTTSFALIIFKKIVGIFKKKSKK